jgi:hypothetical protein
MANSRYHREGRNRLNCQLLVSLQSMLRTFPHFPAVNLEPARQGSSVHYFPHQLKINVVRQYSASSRTPICFQNWALSSPTYTHLSTSFLKYADLVGNPAYQHSSANHFLNLFIYTIWLPR